MATIKIYLFQVLHFWNIYCNCAYYQENKSFNKSHNMMVEDCVEERRVCAMQIPSISKTAHNESWMNDIRNAKETNSSVITRNNSIYKTSMQQWQVDKDQFLHAHCIIKFSLGKGARMHGHIAVCHFWFLHNVNCVRFTYRTPLYA